MVGEAFGLRGQRSGEGARCSFGIVELMLVFVEAVQRLVSVFLVEYGGDLGGAMRQSGSVGIGTFEEAVYFGEV